MQVENVEYGDEGAENPYRANMKVRTSGHYATHQLLCRKGKQVLCSRTHILTAKPAGDTMVKNLDVVMLAVGFHCGSQWPYHANVVQVVTVEPGGHTRDHSRKIRLLLVSLRLYGTLVPPARKKVSKVARYIHQLINPLLESGHKGCM